MPPDRDRPEPKLDVAIVASEGVPFAKTGGLADVVGSLPRALERLGHRAAVFLPAHRSARVAAPHLRSTGVDLAIPVGSRLVEGTILAAELPGSTVPVYLIDQPGYFDRDQIYGRDGVDYRDNCERFIFFGRAVLEAIRQLGLKVDVIHCNDWQTGLIPAYVDEMYRGLSRFANVGTLLTIHNMAYQGTFWHWDVPLTGFDWRLFNWRQLEHHGRLNFLKAGLAFADRLNTVSPTYAAEIQTSTYGCGLDDLLRGRRADLSGIVNGIDPTAWDPAIDPHLATNYDIRTAAVGKAACKAELQRRASLPERPGTPVLAQIGRLAVQKGWDLLVEVADDLLKGDVQLVVLGEGHAAYREALDRLAARHPGKIGAFFEFSNPLAHQIEAGADLFLMPSLYEPCGLNQLFSQAYGTVPIVHATGGLVDTVVDADSSTLADGTATGFAFSEPTAAALRGAIDRALMLWPDRAAWARIVEAGMRADWSWDRSARAYVGLYEQIRAKRATGPGVAPPQS